MNDKHQVPQDPADLLKEFETLIDALNHEGVTFNESTITNFKKRLREQIFSEKAPSTNTKETHLEDPSEEEKDLAMFDYMMEKSEQEEADLKKKLTDRLRNRTLIVGAGAWQQHWEKKKKPGMNAQMEEIEAYEHDINKPLEPTHDDLKASIPPELLKRFSTKIIVMEPMKKQDYLDLIPKFTEALPLPCQGLFRKLATEQVSYAHKNLLGMRFFEEVLTQTLTAEMAPSLHNEQPPSEPTPPSSKTEDSPPENPFEDISFF